MIVVSKHKVRQSTNFLNAPRICWYSRGCDHV